jgi:hypothetical protein
MPVLLKEDISKINRTIIRNFPGPSNLGIRRAIRESLETGRCERISKQHGLTRSGMIGLQQVDEAAKAVSVVVSVDYESNAEEFWSTSPNTAAMFRDSSIVRISKAILRQLQEIPGWNSGPLVITD